MHPVPASPKDAPAPDDDAAPSVLVVEDDAVLALQLCQALEEAGLRVIGPCFSYREALATIARQPPRRAVVDLDLGRGDLRPGFEGERILAILTNAGCRCVVHSGRSDLFGMLGRCFPRAALIPSPPPWSASWRLCWRPRGERTRAKASAHRRALGRPALPAAGSSLSGNTLTGRGALRGARPTHGVTMPAAAA